MLPLGSLALAALLVSSGCSGVGDDKPATAAGSTYYSGKMNADSEGGVRKKKTNITATGKP
jgi:uncharacterized protein YceK